MELNLKNLAPLLQCTSINRCALFMRAKNIYIYIYYFIEFLSSLLLKKKKILFLSFSLSLQLLLFLPLPVLHFNQTVPLYSVRCSSLLSPHTSFLLWTGGGGGDRGGGGCGWYCDFFWVVEYIILLQWLQYFIVMFILFYCVES